MALFESSKKQEEEYKLIFERIHPKIKAKQKIYKLILDSYAGTTQFKQGEYLRRGLLEYSEEYKKRLEDSTYENFIQPANDTLSGLLYSQPITRNFTGDYVEIAERITKDKGISEFMMNVVAPNSLMISGGVLIDAPKIPDEYLGKLSKADQIKLDLYPYAVYYPATLIRDFAEDGSWIILDDSYLDDSDPFVPCKKVECRTLWTKTEIIKYTKKTERWEDVVKIPSINTIGEIPFIWCNWRDINNDKITESPFEDIAELNKSIYNIDSIITESAFQSSFSQLIYQGDWESTIKKILDGQTTGPVGSLSVIPISPDASIPPSYIQRPLANIAVLIELEQGRINRIFNKIGLGNTSDKTINIGWRSRKIEFEKCEAILRGWAEGMENVEEQIFYFMGKYQVLDGTYEIEYPQDFQSDSVMEKMEALKDVLLLPLDELNRLKVQAELLKLAGIEMEEPIEKPALDATNLAKQTGNTPPAGEE